MRCSGFMLVNTINHVNVHGILTLEYSGGGVYLSVLVNLKMLLLLFFFFFNKRFPILFFVCFFDCLYHAF